MNSKDKIEQIDMGKNEVNDDDDDGSKGGSVSSSSAISGHDSMTDTSGRGGGTSTGGTSASSLSLAQQETRTVRRIKFLVLAVIGLAAITCSVFTFIFVAASESKTFQAQFSDYAIEIADLSYLKASSTVKSLVSLSGTISSLAVATDSTFPNFTVPSYEFHGTWSNNISKVTQVTFAPLVTKDDRLLWESYATEHQDWLQESLDAQYNDLHTDHVDDGNHSQLVISSFIYQSLEGAQEQGMATREEIIHEDVGPWAYAPVWQQVPAPHDPSIVNYDLLANTVFARTFRAMLTAQKPVLSEPSQLEFLYGGAIHDAIVHPHSFLLTPVFESVEVHEENDIVGLLASVVSWDIYFKDILHEGANGIIVVLDDPIGDQFTYMINGPEAIFLGDGDLHDPKYNNLEVRTPFAPFLAHEQGEYYLRVYPSVKLENHYKTNKPFWFAATVLVIFAFTAMVFLLFDYSVAARQQKMMIKAKRTHAIISSLFPANVRDRMLKEAEEKELMGAGASKQSQLRDFLGKKRDDDDGAVFDTKPIADLFPSATVLFADIVGFTAWSSTREPTQVFTLLESVYHAFDKIAQRRRVFKVETIGDCYVAVAGLPEPRPDHAVVMARFARECLERMETLTSQLEVTLGPDTADLSMRMGMHSGPVTAGVLRGDKGRFQLFGDTVNTASRMESNGARNRIHCSKETVALLEQAGKEWAKPREDLVHAKGKGEMQTYWIETSKTSNPSGSVSTDDRSIDTTESWIDSAGRVSNVQNGIQCKIYREKMQRLVDWNTDVFCRLLKQVVGRQQSSPSEKKSNAMLTDDFTLKSTAAVIDEVVETIELPQVVNNAKELLDVELSEKVVGQVHHYVQTIASMYRDNPFHNFEHASHVTMSVTKLMSRIVAPSDSLLDRCRDATTTDLISTLHDHTYGITSDPLTQFACVFSALIHDVDHTGVPNAQLVKENQNVAIFYKGKSVAEQNSVDLAWDLFVKPEYIDFRKALCCDIANMKRFRQLVVNSVMATDIMDKDLKTLRDIRWGKAFRTGEPTNLLASYLSHEQINRKATVVLEHVLQASDISHTMQHWHVYRKWNERLFHENMLAFQEGRAEKNPADFWYQGEIGFFDFYILPLTKKLKDCGVFGVSSDEYHNYAEKNRSEWVLRGQEIVANMVEKYDYQGIVPISKELVPLVIIQPSPVSPEINAPISPEMNTPISPEMNKVVSASPAPQGGESVVPLVPVVRDHKSLRFL